MTENFINPELADHLEKRSKEIILNYEKLSNEKIFQNEEEVLYSANALENVGKFFGGHHEYFGFSKGIDDLIWGITACDIAEKIISQHIFSEYRTTPENQKNTDPDPISKAQLSVMIVSRQLQWYLYKRPDLGFEYTHGSSRPSDFYYFRDFTSTRRYMVHDRYKGGLRELYEWTPKPSHLSIEAVIHRATIYNLNVTTFSGPCELLGMTRISANLSYTDQPKTWKDIVVSFLNTGSGNAIILPSNNEGTIWEQQHVALDTRQRVVALICLPEEYDQHFSKYWLKTRKIFGRCGYDIPRYRKEGLIVVIQSSGQVRDLTFDVLFDNRFRESLLS